jgi:hypothetical protein
MDESDGAVRATVEGARGSNLMDADGVSGSIVEDKKVRTPTYYTLIYLHTYDTSLPLLSY